MSIFIYQSKVRKLAGSNYAEVYRNARHVFQQISRKTKRRPYIRSEYFKKQKIFFDYFCDHLRQKSPRERYARLKYFNAAIDVLKHSRFDPLSQQNPHKPDEILHRFAGLTPEKELFYIQVKEDKRTGRKYFMSCFPIN